MCNYDVLNQMDIDNVAAKRESDKGKTQTHTHTIATQQHLHKTNRTYQNPANANCSTKPYNQKTTHIIDTIPTTDTPAILDPQQRIYQSSIGEIGEFIPEKPIKYIEPTTTIGTKTIGDLTNIPDSWLKPTE